MLVQNKYAHKDPETASAVTWLKSFCGLAHKLAYQDPSEDVLHDLSAFITWFTDELLQHADALGNLPSIVEPLVALRSEHPAIFKMMGMWTVLQAMVASGIASVNELPKNHLKPSALSFLYDSPLHKAFCVPAEVLACEPRGREGGEAKPA